VHLTSVRTLIRVAASTNWPPRPVLWLDFLKACLGRALLLGSVAVWLLNGPHPAAAQVGVASDPICRLRSLPDGAAISGKLEYDVKAALLYRCLQLVEWPSTNSAQSPDEVTIGIFGKNQFGDSLDCLSGKRLAGRQLTVKKVSKLARAARCQLLFVSVSEDKRTSKVLESLGSLPVLTIGEAPGFTERGGIINLLLEGKNIRLEVNAAAAEKAGLLLDPRLVKLAEALAAPTPPQSTGDPAVPPSGG
jgi:uncharacterized protein DUF4154